MFAISSTSTDANEVFQLMTDTIDSLLQKYDSSRIRYGLLVYDDDTTVVVHLQNNTDADQIQELLATILPSVGGSALDKALETAAEIFTEAGDRQDADRVLVIMTDKTSGLDDDVVVGATKPLEKMAVKIIPVLVGDAVKPKEFVVVSPKGNIITTKKDKDPEDLSEEIIERVISKYAFSFSYDLTDCS